MTRAGSGPRRDPAQMNGTARSARSPIPCYSQPASGILFGLFVPDRRKRDACARSSSEACPPAASFLSSLRCRKEPNHAPRKTLDHVRNIGIMAHIDGGRPTCSGAHPVLLRQD